MLTGRKIIVDTYGGAAPHGGGAFSGKDPSKVDSSGAYAACWIAKTIVAAGLVRRATVQLSYAIGFLLTATPINNRLTDFQHMVELFSRHQPDHFAGGTLGIHSLPGYIRQLERKIEKEIFGTDQEELDLNIADVGGRLSTASPGWSICCATSWNGRSLMISGWKTSPLNMNPPNWA